MNFLDTRYSLLATIDNISILLTVFMLRKNTFKLQDRILLAHGSGGRLTHELIEQLFVKHFSNRCLDKLEDAAALNMPGLGKSQIAFTTDSFVVDPIFFPGGDIGTLSVCGTVNDLAMKGAKPLALSLSAIIEEGFEIGLLEKIVASIAKNALKAGVSIVTGDTKVVQKTKADKIFLTSSGIGIVAPGTDISAKNSKPGDAVIVSGSIGDHGTAVLCARNDFKLESNITSDCAPLNHLVEKMLNAVKDIHAMRDPTRGGLATTLNEIAKASNTGIIIEEKLVPVKRQVRSVCDILGIDPLYMPSEGRLVAITPDKCAQRLLNKMKSDSLGRGSRVIGKVVKSPKGVWLKTSLGGLRPLIMLEGEQLPRIC
jgi:hydrogenase expression/formation protein HypE